MKKLVMSALVVSLLGIAAGAFAQQGSGVDCKKISNPTKRLSCYEAQDTKKAGAANEKKKNIDAAIKILRKMGTAVANGMSRDSYGSRLTDMVTDIDEVLPSIQNSEVKTVIAEAMQAYVDAMELWNRTFEATFAESFRIGHEDMLKKYGISIAEGKMDSGDRANVVTRPWAYAKMKTELAADVSRSAAK